MHIPEEQVPNVIHAVEHYAAYLRATKRDDRPYLIIAESLKLKPGAQPSNAIRISPPRRPRPALKSRRSVRSRK